MNDRERREAAKQFAQSWAGRGDEKQETQAFWMALLQKVFDVPDPEKYISFELPVRLSHTSFIDGFIRETRVLIEQKSQDIDLRKGYKQSDGSVLTPYMQARRYAGYLPHDMNPRWIVVSNFQEFHIHDMNRPNDEAEVVMLSDLEREYTRLNFMVDTGDAHIRREMDISMQAGELVGKLYDAFLKQYKDPSAESTLKSLNALCVRLVFCLYAEDAGIFGKRDMFHDFLQKRGMINGRRALRDLFHVLDQRPEERDPYLADDDPELAAFPYVNGGLFSDENIEIPPFNEEIYDLLLTRASEDFNWSEISPTIFGAVFESTLNPETRRKGGMHYTSIENIHKVTDPLFLDDLRAELEEIKQIAVPKTRERRLTGFQAKLAGLTFLDPACGSGNFLTETYLSLRKLENEALSLLLGGQIALGIGELNPIKVSIGQFYGIEINDFAATVAKTALWIAESQMMKQTEDIVHMNLDFLPLKSYVNIIEGNALRIDWETVVPRHKLNYIMGNPPFVGGMYMTDNQKADMNLLFADVKGVGEMDYVCAWYKKASVMLKDTLIRAAFVSTNSICQGEQVLTFWKHMIQECEIHIDYAYTTFIWNSESQGQAKVHCVIIGFSGKRIDSVKKRLYNTNTNYKVCDNINPYLSDTATFFIESRSKPICAVPAMRFGSMPRDGGNFVLSTEEKIEFIKTEPLSQKWIRPYIGAVEFLNNKERYCLWLVDAEPAELNQCPKVKKRIEAVREFRASSKAAGTRKFAETPALFCQIAQPDTDYIMVPKTSSGKRKYLPMGFQSKNTIASDLVFLIPDADLYSFGVLMSNVHNAWIRLVAGRLKSDYRYSKDIVYNNFPWPEATCEQRKKVEETARAILDARAQHATSTLAELYNDDLMPIELRKAHQQNDRAVMEAYGMPIRGTTEASCVAELMRRYQELTR